MSTKTEGGKTPRGTKNSVYSYKTKAGTRWCFSYRDSTGRQSMRRGFLSKSEARKERDRLMGPVHDGRVRISRETLHGWWESWLVSRKPYLETGSWNDYRRHGERRIVPHIGHRKLTSLSAPDVREWIVELSEAGDYKPKTLNNALTALTVCLNQAVAEGLLPVNPAAYVKALPLGHMERDYLRLREIGVYVEACDDAYRLLAETLIATGMRISEALALVVGDLDIDRRAVVVSRSFKDDGSVGSTKSDRFRRVDIGPQLMSQLSDQAARRMEQSESTATETLMFVMPIRVAKGDRGRYPSAGMLGRLDRNTVSGGWHKHALQQAAIRDMPLHSLRHTAAAAWLSTGQPLMYVQRQLGHAQITTTERLYGHLEESFVKQAAADTEAAIARARTR